MGLESKHRKRDLKIPEHRQKLMKKIEQDLLQDENVLAVFYGGSIGSENTDLYSDIDLRIVVKDDVFEHYRFNKKERAKNWGNVLFFEDIPMAIYSVAHYDTFIKVDSFYYKLVDIHPSVWLQNIRIVFDKKGFLDDIVKDSHKLTYHPTAQEVKLWRTKFFAYIHEAYRRVNRQEIYYALSCLDNIRMSMVMAWYMEKGLQPNTFGDWSKYEGVRSELENWQVSLLADWHSSRNPKEIMNTIEEIVPEFKKTHSRLCEIVGMEERSEWVDRIVRMVI